MLALMGTYDIAQICRNGHVSNARFRGHPENNEAFCGKCGSPTLIECESCTGPIRGYRYPTPREIGGPYVRPAYCLNCGQPYPWTSDALQAARELAGELDGLSDQERETLRGTLDDLVSDTPRTQVATARFKKLAEKTGKEGAGLLKNVLYGVVTEAVRRGIWGP